MINNFYKIIHNKYSRFFEFIFFLRYLIVIFLISIALYLSIPIFFNYEKKANVIKVYLLENYNFKISEYKKIKYNIFPQPNLEINDVQINLKSFDKNLNVKKLKIYPNFLNIYNYENFNSKKIVLIDSNITFQITNFKLLTKQLFNKKNKLHFDDLNFQMVNKKTSVITLKNIKFANFGHHKNIIRGKVFKKNFKFEIDENIKNINFKLLNSGINANINFDKNQKENLKFGIFRSKILNTNFKTNFEYDGKVIKLYNSYFRSKNLSFKNKGKITLSPFLESNSEFIIDEINNQIFTEANLINLLKFKDLIKKINNSSIVKYKSKKLNRKFLDDLNVKINLAYGRMNYSKKILIENNIIQCEGDINFLEEYPLLYFDCLVKAESKKEFLKKFSLKTKNTKEKFELKVNGNLSVLNRKVNFKNISTKNYNASKEDLRYFKNTFEDIIFDKSFLEIFDKKKIKKFILEIS